MAQALTQVGKYRIERELGRGAMGVVYKAFDPVVERSVALKTIPLGVEDAEALAHRLHREAKSVGQLEHPNIVTLYDAGEAEGLFYLAMQFIEGYNLEARLAQQGRFTLPEVHDLFRQICAGLDYAHERGVIHRDIKPANIMITRDGVVKLTDFGIAKQMGSAGASTHGLIVGTPSYMSPEQALGKVLDGRSDIFSLGSILYELITGEKAFPGQNTTTVMYKIVYEAPTPLRTLQPALDPYMEAIVTMALAKKPEERFQTCAALAQALDLYMNKELAPLSESSSQAAAAATIVAGEEKVRPAERVAAEPPPPAPETPADAEVRAGVPLRAPAVSTPVPERLPPRKRVSQPEDLPTEVIPTAPSARTGKAAPADSTTSSRAPAEPTPIAPAPHPGLPWAWLGFGVLGTLLLVVVILLIVQLRGPSQNAGQRPASPPQSAASQTTSTPPASGPATDAVKAGGPASAPAESPGAGLKSASPSTETATREAVSAPTATKKSSAGRASPTRRVPPPLSPRRETVSSETQRPKPSPAVPSAPGMSALGQLGTLQKPATTNAPSAPGATTSGPAAVVKPAPTPAVPEDYNALVLKGDLAFQQSKYQDALNAYSKAYTLNNTRRELRRKIAVTLTLLGRPEEAQKYK